MKSLFSLCTVILWLFGFQGANAVQSWPGSNLYYAAGLNTVQQDSLLGSLQSAGIKVLRVWLDGQTETQKGTNIVPFPSLEPNAIGTYNDTVLERLDDVMVKAASYGIKLSIAIHSYNALSGGDVYGQAYGTSDFYTNSAAISSFEQRISHVLAHVNPHNNKPWSESSEYIFAFEAQNEAMNNKGTDFIAEHAGWQCTVAQAIKDGLKNRTDILVTTGGQGWLDVSMQDAYFSCAALDVIAIHAYGAADYDTSRLAAYVDKAKSSGKKLLMQEWGACYYDTVNNRCNQSGALDEATRAQNLRTWAEQISAAGIPWMYWQVIPNADPHWDYDYEIGTPDGDIWEAFKQVALDTETYEAAFDFSPWLL
ncbi:glycoside hydrolase family 5 protein [Aplosporella prunicola CBS 121167]|uniref:mannan endo-1,4-beta-mannosidase n=1 Tax=Aplosporella prunicola CBS 121167 TaxID=1176127 RepID=A0A6A6B6J9_9PEZI|nr:glycoside hydrolase family 5 protein [Aplosporella prunicola CBS 121167]KAF2138607.1 glycoside hydrolase family 5 protein [Aplosporella prunicola CBS 121167]